ncbi:MAG: hypothetical protein PHP62_02835 [Candidatus Moranbacteria bacterium]|nr:hypothetical protein [Candidatus Moranbacteria bacterium]
MKTKLNWLKKWGVLFSCLFLFSACGGGGSDSSSTTPTNPPVNDPVTPPVDDPVTPPTNPPVNPPPARVSLAAISAADLIENLNILINQSHVNLFPELGNVAVHKAIVAEINAVIAGDVENKKRYALGELVVYPDSDFNTTTNRISGNPNYIRANNNFIGNSSYAGTTLVLWYYDGVGVFESGVLPKYFIDNGGGTGYANVENIGGKIHSVAYVAKQGSGDFLLAYRNSGEKYVNGFSAHDANLRTAIHEIVGHLGAGAGVPEQYSLNFTDKSGTLPNLSYDFTALYFEDPMVQASVMKYNVLQIKFSPFNSWLIAHNANHQLNLWQISRVVETMTVKVKVIDKTGNPVSGATVVSYGAVATSGSSWGIAKDMAGSPLETRITGADGTTSLTNRINKSWFVEGVKVSKGFLDGGAILNSYDMQAAYWMHNLDEYVLVITVDTNLQKAIWTYLTTVQ